jgi:hypothetical protein
MFPFVHLSKRPWFGPALLVASLVLLSLTPRLLDCPSTSPPASASRSDVSYLSEMEHHLQAKACQVVQRFSSQPYTVDLSLQLDTVATTTTTYLPGEKILVQSQEKRETQNCDQYENSVNSQRWELTGTWTESVDVRPRTAAIHCLVSLTSGGEAIDQDHLYQCLSYALGLDLERGDRLKIVVR